MSLDPTYRPIPAAAARFPVLGWGAFYLLLLGAWLGLAWLGPDRAGGSLLDTLLARCLAPLDATGFGPLFLMWALMSLGMMLPTSAPTLRRFAILARQDRDARPGLQFLIFLSAYVAVWLGFALAAAALQVLLARVAPAQVMPARFMPGAEPLLAAALLAGAGLYQFSRLKHACLVRCRHPMTFFMMHWRGGPGGAFFMGWKHGLDCLGCCWALMLLSLIGGTMNLAWMGFGMILMALEKLAGAGRFVTIPLGLILIAAAGFVLGNLRFAI
ncbi:DUF2182 domain-containing protein [Dongia sp.]|uniref:DUF2182 domain-containing protein n=1 Tax=Dongia sp. TaxID=1977262 RepID=UPI0035AF71F8